MDIIIKVINSIIFVISGIFILKTFFLYFFLIKDKKNIIIIYKKNENQEI